MTLARIFTDHCVLQRQNPIAIFGTGTNGKSVTVALYHNGKLIEKQESTVLNGRFLVLLQPKEAMTDCTLIVSDDETTVSCEDVAIGEVWLCGGQSNMEFELQNMEDGHTFLEKETDHHVRFYYTMKNSFMDEQFFLEEQNSAWSTFNKEKMRYWSAVGYLTARQLADTLGVIVGVIGCNWGGTSASAWMDRERLCKDPMLKSYVDEYDEQTKGLSVKEQVAAYDRYTEEYNAWNEACAKLYAQQPDIEWETVNKILGPCQYPGPMNCKSPFRPAGLHECMIKRVAPYSLRGFWYYQGESDDHKPRMYEKLLKELIFQWREDFMDQDLPFMIVQLPMHRWKQDPDTKNWCLIRQAQQRVYETVANTGLAVCIDCGEFNEIHPKKKDVVAHRLFLQSMYYVYRKLKNLDLKKEEYLAPCFLKKVIKEDGIVVYFSNADDGFVTKKVDAEKLPYISKEQSGFEIAGQDGNYIPADIVIGDGVIAVSSLEVKNPLSVRYLWTNYREDIPLYNHYGLPVAPFCSE